MQVGEEEEGGDGLWATVSLLLLLFLCLLFLLWLFSLDDRGQDFTLFMFLNNFTFPKTWLVEKDNNEPTSVEQGSEGRGRWDGRGG